MGTYPKVERISYGRGEDLMSTNRNLGDLNAKNVKQSSSEDPTETFDISRGKRQEALNQVKDLLERASQGSKFTQKDFKKAFSALYTYNSLTEKLIVSFLNDTYRIVKAVAQSEVSIFALRTNVKALVRALDRKELINRELIEEIHDKEILPEELKQMGVSEEEIEEMRKD
jgi:hypothetical protein